MDCVIDDLSQVGRDPIAFSSLLTKSQSLTRVKSSSYSCLLMATLKEENDALELPPLEVGLYLDLYLARLTNEPGRICQ